MLDSVFQRQVSYLTDGSAELARANEKTVRVEGMKYKLIIDKNIEEEIIAVVHAPSSLTQQIENLVCSFSGTDCIMGYRLINPL